MTTLSYAITAALLGASLLACGGQGQTPKDDPAKSKAAFTAMSEVLTHPRCLNCHPSDDSPTQGEDMSAHQPPVFRGEGGLGAVGMRCNTCHGEANAPLTERAGSMPGAVGWHLAPLSMGWQGKSTREICEQLKDKARNGGKSLDELHQHVSSDPFVAWGWEPGEGRTSAPGTQADFAKNTRAWIDSGAHCPE
ncbi:MAG: hypothetical protein Tsb0020_01380 [Haliangiales bacterium]